VGAARVTVAFYHERAALLAGRCEELIPRVLAPKSVGLILTDPPYSEHTHANLGREKRKDGGKQREALEFPPLTVEQIAELARLFVATSTGWILVFTDDRSVHAWGESLERAGGRWVRTGHWIKTNPMPQMTGDRPSVGTEPIVIARADDEDEGYPDVVSHPIVIGHSYTPGVGRMSWRGGGRAACWRGPGPSTAERVHPNQKPLWLLQELAALFAPPGATVLDPFAGSASLGLALLARERFAGSKTRQLPALPDAMSFIGMEQHAPYVQAATERLRAAVQGA
jgi:site-specific DNA-methyltransferase (adenine-specific)